MKSKLMIPSLLLGVVMIAGAFAFMPVQEASTVHTTIIASTGTSVIQTGNVGGDADVTVFDLTGTTKVARGTICVIITDGGADTTTGLVQVNAGGTAVTALDNAHSELGECVSFATDKLVIKKPGETTSTDEIEYDASWVEDDV